MSEFYSATEAAGAAPGVPGFVFGVIAFSVFLLLGFVTWTYRDVATSHEAKSGKGSH